MDLNQILTWVQVMVKGGSLKTAASIQFATLLSQLFDLKTCLLEMDPQGSIRDYYGLDPHSPSIDDIIDNRADVKKVLQVRQGIGIVPANLNLVFKETAPIGRLKLKLKYIINELSDQFQVFLIDTPASAGALTKASMAVADVMTTPCPPEQMSWVGLEISEKLKWQVNNEYRSGKPLIHLGIFLTKVRGREHSREMVGRLRKEYSKYPGVFETVIPDSIVPVQASYHMEDVITWDRSSRIATAYRKLTREIIQRIKEERNAKKQ